jgi:hypothetical protein
VPDMELQDLVLALPGFGLVLVWSLLAIHLFVPFGLEMFILCHCLLEVCNLFFIFVGAHS